MAQCVRFLKSDHICVVLNSGHICLLLKSGHIVGLITKFIFVNFEWPPKSFMILFFKNVNFLYCDAVVHSVMEKWANRWVSICAAGTMKHGSILCTCFAMCFATSVGYNGTCTCVFKVCGNYIVTASKSLLCPQWCDIIINWVSAASSTI